MVFTVTQKVNAFLENSTVRYAVKKKVEYGVETRALWIVKHVALKMQVTGVEV